MSGLSNINIDPAGRSVSGERLNPYPPVGFKPNTTKRSSVSGSGESPGRRPNYFRNI